MTLEPVQYDLEATIQALGSGDAKGRRDFEAYLGWAKLERDWLNSAELGHLKRAIAFATKRNRSLGLALERTKPIQPQANNTSEAQTEPEKSVSDAPAANLGEMARELQALRASSEAVRLEHEQVALKLKTEYSYQAAWERRLEHAEDEVRALWKLIEEIVRLTGLTAPRLEKLERRVGYGWRQSAGYSKAEQRVGKSQKQ